MSALEPDTIGTAQPLAARETFNGVAALYDQMRPGYPSAVFDRVTSIAGLNQRSRLLEVGCGTGHATFEFARHGLAIDCIELGENMAALARQRLAEFPRVSITVTDFDLWTTPSRYNLIYIATAYHWLNQQTRVARLASLLEPGGRLAVWRNHHARTNGASSEFYAAAQKVYLRIAPELVHKFGGLLTPEAIPQPEKDEWQASGLFTDVQTHTWLWSRDYTASEYAQMLATHSNHQMLDEHTRAALLNRLARLVDDFGGQVTSEYVTLLHMARKPG